MIRFAPSSAAEPLSLALWELSRPPQVQRAGDTKYLFGWIDDLQGNRWLRVDTEFQINIHELAEFNGIADILQPWIDAGQLPANTNTQLAALVESLRGGRLVVYNAFPQLFKDMSKTYPEMIAAGLLTEPGPP